MECLHFKDVSTVLCCADMEPICWMLLLEDASGIENSKNFNQACQLFIFVKFSIQSVSMYMKICFLSAKKVHHSYRNG